MPLSCLTVARCARTERHGEYESVEGEERPICGFVWETWGFWLHVKWVYSVPYLHRFCYAEMPLIGFAGYLPFGIEALLVCGWLGLHDAGR